MRGAPCRYWEKSSPYFLGCFYPSLPQGPATVCVFKSVISAFCAALSDRGCAVTIWADPQNGSAPSHLFQSFMTNTNFSSFSSQTLKHSVTSLHLKISPDFNVFYSFPGEAYVKTSGNIHFSVPCQDHSSTKEQLTANIILGSCTLINLQDQSTQMNIFICEY